MSETAEQLPETDAEHEELNSTDIESAEPEQATVDTPDDDPKPEPTEAEKAQAAQDKINEAINRQARKRYEAEQKAAEEARKRQELEEKLAKFEKPERPAVPKLPDRYDFDSDQEYAQAVDARDKALQAQVQWDLNQQNQQRQQQESLQAQQRAEQERLMQLGESFGDNAKKLGISDDALSAAAVTVGQFGINPEIGQHILSDAQGPEITLYLAKNLSDLEQLAAMTPMRAAIFIEQVKEKAKASRSKKDIPPAPTETPQGSGLAEGNDDEKWGTYS